MTRRKRRISVTDIAPAVVGIGAAAFASPALKKQSRYSDTPWQPGEIPTRSGSLMPVTGRLDAGRAPYGEFMGVECPGNHGRGKPHEEQA
jgi:hypothetical protein